jgi:hypothetical protein
MRHNITLTKETSGLLKELCETMGLKPSAVITTALRTLKKQETTDKGRES